MLYVDNTFHKSLNKNQICFSMIVIIVHNEARKFKLILFL